MTLLLLSLHVSSPCILSSYACTHTDVIQGSPRLIYILQCKHSRRHAVLSSAPSTPPSHPFPSVGSRLTHPLPLGLALPPGGGCCILPERRRKRQQKGGYTTCSADHGRERRDQHPPIVQDTRTSRREAMMTKGRGGDTRTRMYVTAESVRLCVPDGTGRERPAVFGIREASR